MYGGASMDINKDLVAASATPLVLAILAERDSYGYAILKRVSELSGGRLEWSDGMLYPVLHRLERLGYIAGSAEVGDRAAAQSTTDHAARKRAARRGAPAVAGRRPPRLRNVWSLLAVRTAPDPLPQGG